jgi:hypothetical protein
MPAASQAHGAKFGGEKIADLCRRQLPFAGQLRRDRWRGHQNPRRNGGENDDRRQQAGGENQPGRLG